MKSPTKTVLDAPTVILTLALLVAVSFIVVLSRQNSRLTKQTGKLKGELATLSGTLSGPAAAEVGDIVPPFETIDLEENRIQVAYDRSSRYLFYIFSPRCGACISQFPVWNHLAMRAKTKNCLPLGVSIMSAQATKQLLKDIEQNFRVVIMPNEAIQRSYRVVAEPAVMLITANGVVDWVHYGTLGVEEVSEVLSRIESGTF